MKKHIIIILVCIIVAGVFTRVYLGFQKVYFHMDEAYSYGLMNYGNMKVYVTSGIGAVLFPLRLFAYPEVVIITFKSKS